MRFSRDGKLAAIGNASGQARVFSTTEWSEVTRPLGGSAGVVEAPAISPDGGTLATGGLDGIRHACRIAGRRLTPAEWQEFLPGRSYEPAC